MLIDDPWFVFRVGVICTIAGGIVTAVTLLPVALLADGMSLYEGMAGSIAVMASVMIATVFASIAIGFLKRYGDYIMRYITEGL